MDSSFLVWANVGLGVYSVFLFLKFIIQFGRPNHPVRLISYIVLLCASVYFVMLGAMELGFIHPFLWEKWRLLPLVAGGLCLLIQVIMMVGKFTLIQQKIVSRIPFIGALLCLFFFPGWGNHFFALSLAISCLFLSISVGKARYQKRQFFKMILFLSSFFISKHFYFYWSYLLGDVLLFFSLFYFSIFEQSFGVASVVSQEGVVT